MNISMVKIISDDSRLHDAMRAALAGALSCDVTGLSWSSCPWADDSMAADGRRAPQVILVDLRDDARWDQLAALRPTLDRLTAGPVSLVAIVEPGIPLAWAHTADLTFAASIDWPCPKDQLVRQMRDSITDKRSMPAPHQHYDEYRSLETTTGTWTTYTPELFSVLDDLKVAAQHEFTVLLVGETGTGKTMLARIVHELSPRSQQRFLTVPCGALPNDLIDSELFGHVKGAFTGADRTKEGKFDAANGGSILLDEIDVLALPQQAKLLRVLETGEFEAVGSNETRRANVRSIVASNIDLRDLVDQERFRVDLYFRLNQIRFEIPPLRNRTRDIVPLAISFIQECCREHALDVWYIHPEFVAAIKACHWPGNIRQLRNEVRRAVLFCRDGVLAASHLSPEVRSEIFETGQPGEAMVTPSGLAGEVAQREQMAIERMLRTQKFNRTATARALGISRVTLYNKIRKYGIRVDVTRRPTDASTRNLN